MSADFHKPIEIAHLHSFSFYLTWRQETVGFGELSTSDHEGMSKEWVRRALYAAVDKYISELP